MASSEKVEEPDIHNDPTNTSRGKRAGKIVGRLDSSIRILQGCHQVLSAGMQIFKCRRGVYRGVHRIPRYPSR
jgi:hypothetical protein